MTWFVYSYYNHMKLLLLLFYDLFSNVLYTIASCYFVIIIWIEITMGLKYDISMVKLWNIRLE